MEELDIFGATQTQAGDDGDDKFTALASAIAVRKCRLVQKKEKIKCKFGTITPSCLAYKTIFMYKLTS